MTAQVGAIEIVVPDDASALTEPCVARYLPDLRFCGAPAAYRALFACPDCDSSRAIPLCGFHKDKALRMEVISGCHRARMTPIAVEALR